MTKEKDKGDRFEIWTENLLRDLGYDRVRRNVNYHKKYKKNAYRQVDIEYVNYLNPFETFVILELKYSNNGNISLNFRDGRKKARKSGQLMSINNIVDELEERRRFVKADHAILVTNKKFDNAIKKQASRYRIRLYDKKILEKFDRRRFFGFFGLIKPKLIDRQIKSIKLRGYRRTSITDYIR